MLYAGGVPRPLFRRPSSRLLRLSPSDEGHQLALPIYVQSRTLGSPEFRPLIRPFFRVRPSA